MPCQPSDFFLFLYTFPFLHFSQYVIHFSSLVSIRFSFQCDICPYTLPWITILISFPTYNIYTISILYPCISSNHIQNLGFITRVHYL